MVLRAQSRIKENFVKKKLLKCLIKSAAYTPGFLCNLLSSLYYAKYTTPTFNITKCYFLFNLGYCKGELEESGRKVGGEGGGGGRGEIGRGKHVDDNSEPEPISGRMNDIF